MTLILFFALFKFRGAKFILTFHSFRDDLKHAKPLRRKIMNISLRLASHCIAANLEIKEKLVSLGARPENISVLPAFLPPSIEEREIKRIPQKVWDFIDNHTPIITVNAFKIVFYQDQDLYGLDLCVELCASLHNDYPKVGLVFCLPEIGDYEYFNKMKQRIAEEGIEDNFLLVTQPYQFYPILMKSHVFIRPTNTDGDATSLREALFFKVPSVASDVCPRPEGTILFKNRDINDLTQKVRELLNNYEPRKKELDLVKIEDNSMKLIEVYQNLMNLKG
jgi:glycosyltransferase involved in cell wall biosynthesis